MERELLKSLFQWMNRADRKPLIIRGARQVGKTWLLKEFGKTFLRAFPSLMLLVVVIGGIVGGANGLRSQTTRGARLHFCRYHADSTRGRVEPKNILGGGGWQDACRDR